MIEFQHVYKSFHHTPLFEDLNLQIQGCGIHIIVGKSGSGKSTLLNMLANYEAIDKGKIICEGKIATIFQNYELIDELNVRENIYCAKEISTTKIKNEQTILNILGLEPLMDYYPHELSGGQRQRVGIARALFQDYSIILCDEPTESLDKDNKHIVMKLLQEVAKHCIVIVVTHDLQMIQEYADKLYRIQNKTIVLEKNQILAQEQILPNGKYNSLKLSHYLNKILLKRTLFYCLFIMALVSLGIGFYVYEKKTFQPFVTQNILCKDRIYVKGKEAHLPLEEFQLNPADVDQIVEFNALMIDNQSYGAEILPLTPNELEINEENREFNLENKILRLQENIDLPIQGNLPHGMEIIINQNLAQRIGKEILQETVTLSFNIQWNEYRVNMKVIGIIEENDTQSEIAYYDKQAFHEYLKNQTGKNYDTLYEEMKELSPFYEVRYPYDQIKKGYEQFSKDPSFIYFNPLYDEREAIMEEKKVFQIVFQSMEGLLFIAILIVIIVYILLDTKRMMKNCSILAAISGKLNSVKFIYLSIKYLIFTFCFWPLSLGMTFLIQNLMNYSLLENEKIFLDHFLLLIYVLYLILQFISIMKLNKEKINQLLKDSHDLI